MMILRCGLLVFALTMGVAKADVPTTRLTTLSRGVNVTTVFDTGPAYLQLLSDLPSIARLGFRHIRIFVDPDWIVQWNPTDVKREHLDRVVDGAVSHGLGVILCMAGKGWTDSSNLAGTQAKWIMAWKRLIDHYRFIPADKLFYELANEPSLSDVPHWASIQEAIRQQMRTSAPSSTFLLTSTPDSTVWGLSALKPSQDQNVVYSFHLYQPMIFTHQGAEWQPPSWMTLKGLDYPPNTNNVSAIRHHVDPSLTNDLENYEKDGRLQIPRELKVAATWARKYAAHVVVTEFGVYRPAPPPSRVAWLSEARSAIEGEGFGWTVWEWNSGFGVKPDMATGQCSRLRDGLGLCH